MFEYCITATAGTATHGMACDPTSVSACEPGSACLSSDGVTGVCYRWCRTDLDCPTGKSCSTGVSFTATTPCSGTLLPPYDVCTL